MGYLHYYFMTLDVARVSTPQQVFSYIRGQKDQTQKNHKQALALLEVKKSRIIIEQQSIGTAYIPPHKFKDSFLDYYEEYVDTHRGD